MIAAATVAGKVRPKSLVVKDVTRLTKFVSAYCAPIATIARWKEWMHWLTSASRLACEPRMGLAPSVWFVWVS